MINILKVSRLFSQTAKNFGAAELTAKMQEVRTSIKSAEL